MNNKYDVEQFYKKLTDALTDGETQRVFPSHFYSAYFKGDRTLFQLEQSESRKFDLMWIKTIESYFPSINRITINVKSTLRYDSELLPVEKTKKINKESVIDLMRHSNQIREINDDGVIPKAVRSSLSEIEYGIYENRFVMTLILRLRDFITKRIKLMKEGLRGTKTSKLNVTSKFDFEGSDVEMSLDIKQKEFIENKSSDDFNLMVLEKAEKLHKLVTRLTTSQFMSYMKRFKPVKPPILKTQIILKNPDFKNAYLLWLFLDKCNDLGYESETKIVHKRFSAEYTKSLNQAMLIAYSAMLTSLKAKQSSTSPEDTVNYKETKAVTLQRLPDDIEIVAHPLTYEVEDNTLNEFYINKAKQLFKNQLSKTSQQEAPEPYTVSVKKMLSDMLEINKSVYESFFSVNADDDVFTRLVKDDNPQEMLNDAYEKFYVAQTVREVKEKDFLETLALEKKWQQELQTRYNELTNRMKKDTVDNLNNQLETDRVKAEKILQETKSDISQQKKQLLRDHKKEVAEYEKKLKEEFRAEKKKIAQDAKVVLAKEKERIGKQAQKQKAEELARYEKFKEKLKLQQQKEREKKKALLEAQKKAEKEAARKKIASFTKEQNAKNVKSAQAYKVKMKEKKAELVSAVENGKTIESKTKKLNLAAAALIDNKALNDSIITALNSTDFKQ